jgi:multidrug efflux pump subunit AcrA (membrane-fusion protein)
MGATPPPDTGPTRAVDRAGDRVVDPAALRSIAVDVEAESIDELFSPLPKADARGTVWKWDETAKQFTAVPVRVGVTDGQMSELLEGDLDIGDELVTNIMVSAPAAAPTGPNPLLGGPRGRGRGR